MKIFAALLFALLLTGFVFAQSEQADPAIQNLPISKKRQISQLFKAIYSATEIYNNSIDKDEIARQTIFTTTKIRKFAQTLPKSFLKDTLITGAGAWEKSFLFRYEGVSGQYMALAKKKEIIKVYKLENIAPEDRATRLFDIAQSFFNIAADVAVAAGVPTN